MEMKKLMMIGLVTLPLLGGCATKMQTGTALGALTGGALAYGLGQDSHNKELWTVLGIGLGAMVGSNIGQQLDERDRILMGQTFNHTMEKAPINATGQWQNPDTGHGGSVTPIRTFDTGTGPCREFTQTVSIGGHTEEAYGTACRQADGSWKIKQ
ncbi:uncharacterized protein METZ01_LOCUS249078 [marine metagenome]|uniref:Surface antigen domain-containing protein n=1 Tax=marine metagenome TaxID=408172 RepID=A0A382I923_9ZZZZ